MPQPYERVSRRRTSDLVGHETYYKSIPEWNPPPDTPTQEGRQKGPKSQVARTAAKRVNRLFFRMHAPLFYTANEPIQNTALNMNVYNTIRGKFQLKGMSSKWPSGLRRHHYDQKDSGSNPASD